MTRLGNAHLQRHVIQLHGLLLADLQRAAALARLQIPQIDAVVSAGGPQRGDGFEPALNASRRAYRWPSRVRVMDAWSDCCQRFTSSG